MNEKCLMILEVGKKQEFIFRDKELARNINNSSLIRWVTEMEYFTTLDTNITAANNLVCSGGGHTILEFNKREDAENFAKKISRDILKRYEGLEFFVKILMCPESTKGEQMIADLVGKLEKKKLCNQSSFYQRSFGIEKIDSNVRSVKNMLADDSRKNETFEKFTKSLDQAIELGAYQWTNRFDQINPAKDGNQFIAVIHIDGNQMGARVTKVKEQPDGMEWSEYKERLRNFSEEIDTVFKNAFKEMTEAICKQLQENQELRDLLAVAEYFPLRRIISAGDDICYVADGRLGLESARLFLESLYRQCSSVDGERYFACAGIAIVHQKYPFYKAYQLAEQLCSNAKKLVLNAQCKASAIDWHLELGNMKESLTEIRKDYQTRDNKHLLMRPYFVAIEEGSEAGAIARQSLRSYQTWAKLLREVQAAQKVFSNSKLKELKYMMKQDQETVTNFLKTNLMSDKLKEIKSEVLAGGSDNFLFYKEKDCERAIFFDSLELLDSCILL